MKPVARAGGFVIPMIPMIPMIRMIQATATSKGSKINAGKKRKASNHIQ